MESSDFDEIRIYNLFFTPQVWSSMGLHANQLLVCKQYLAGEADGLISNKVCVEFTKILNTIEKYVMPETTPSIVEESKFTQFSFGS